MKVRTGNSQRLRIIVGGFLGLLPAGGVAWDYLQYPLGFAEMGHDVYYLEDTRLWPIYQLSDSHSAPCAANVNHLRDVMSAFGLERRWAYRDEASGQSFGLSESAISEICRTADVLVNVSCSTFMREEYLRIPARILIDSDPMFTQIQLATGAMFTSGESQLRQLVAAHTHHFTFGENIGAADCQIPLCGIAWRPTRQPVCLGHWQVSPPPRSAESRYTTVMNWTAGRQLEFAGETWGQKDIEWSKIRTLPRDVPGISLAVAVGQTTGSPFPADQANRDGWLTLDPQVCAADWRSYRDFIRDSRGEISIAKETYVKARTGWFSCRSACYLAAARPVITQDTGWTRNLPHGDGLLAFDDRCGAIEGLRLVESNPNHHSAAAREIAEQYFSSQSVLGQLLSQAGA